MFRLFQSWTSLIWYRHLIGWKVFGILFFQLGFEIRRMICDCLWDERKMKLNLYPLFFIRKVWILLSWETWVLGTYLDIFEWVIRIFLWFWKFLVWQARLLNLLPLRIFVQFFTSFLFLWFLNFSLTFNLMTLCSCYFFDWWSPFSWAFLQCLSTV